MLSVFLDVLTFSRMTKTMMMAISSAMMKAVDSITAKLSTSCDLGGVFAAITSVVEWLVIFPSLGVEIWGDVVARYAIATGQSY